MTSCGKSCGVQMALLLAALPVIDALPREVRRELAAPNWWLVIGALVLLLLVIIWLVDQHGEPPTGESQP